MKFRLVQALTVTGMYGFWITRMIANPYHLHFSMLAMATCALVISELGYRAGKKEAEEGSDNRELA